MKRSAVVSAMAVSIAALGTLVWQASTRGEVVRPADAPEFGEMLSRAARAAQGQRVLAILARHGAVPTGRVFETAVSAEGWQAFAPTPDSSDPLNAALSGLAAVAAADFAGDHRLDETTLRALAVFGVAVVAATDGDAPIRPEIGERDPSVGVAPEVPGLRVRHAQPAFLFLAEAAPGTAVDAISFARSLRLRDADFSDYVDGLWGGALTVDAPREAEFLFPWGAAGARVTVDDKSASFRPAGVPVLVVKLPAGRHRVEVRYGEEHAGRDWLAVAAAALVVGSFVVLWLGLRPHPGRDATGLAEGGTTGN